ncbi:MAG: MIP/aquaporin family protein [Pirellulaceae bacterium]
MTPRPLLICCAAEMLGTFILIFFGLGAVHNAVLVGDLVGLWQVAIVWGLGVTLAIYGVGQISGAHINPAITIGFAAWGLFPWRRVPGYVVSQVIGAFLAAAVLFSLFASFHAAKEEQLGVQRGDPGSIVTASCFGEYFPNPGGLGGGGRYDPQQEAERNKLVSLPIACLAEVICTGILAFMVLALTETAHQNGPRSLAPFFIGLTVAALVCVIAPITQASFNPARDFGPRLFAYFAGWGEVALPGPRTAGWLLVYILSPIVGSIAGCGLYLRGIQPHVSDEPPAGRVVTE